MEDEIYTPDTLRLSDMERYNLHIRKGDWRTGTQLYVAANYSDRREVLLWEEGSTGVKMEDWWSAIAKAACWWINLSEEEKDKRTLR